MDLELDQIADTFEMALRAGKGTRIEDVLHSSRGSGIRLLFRELLAIEIEFKQSRGEVVQKHEYLHRFPEYPEIVDATFGVINEPFARQHGDPITCSACGTVYLSGNDKSQCPRCEQLGDLEFTGRRLGRYELLARLGGGAYGIVWKAFDRRLERTVAVKIPRHFATGKRGHERLKREARAIAQLSHTNIVCLLDHCFTDEASYLVTEYVEGCDLKAWRHEDRSCKEISLIGAQIARALHYAHQRGIVHRDLKPSNILVRQDANPVIVDFGLAQRALNEISLTNTGDLVGTIPYMSPEQAVGEGHLADCRSDIYSFGVVLFELLTGQRPFAETRPNELLNTIAVHPAPDLRSIQSDVPIEMSAICLRCLEKKRSQRFQTAEELAEELERFADGRPVHSRPPGILARSLQKLKPSPYRALILFVGLAFLMVMLSRVGPDVSNREILFDSVNVAAPKLRRYALEEYIEEQREFLDANPDSTPIASSNCKGLVDLHEAQLQDIQLPYKTNLRRLCLIGADLSRAIMSDCYFEHSVLNRVNLTDSGINGCDFSNVDFVGSTLINANINNSGFQHANLNKANFRRARMQRACMAEVRNWIDADLTDAELDHVVVDRSDWIEWVQQQIKHPGCLDAWRVVAIPANAQLPDDRWRMYPYWLERRATNTDGDLTPESE